MHYYENALPILEKIFQGEEIYNAEWSTTKSHVDGIMELISRELKDASLDLYKNVPESPEREAYFNDRWDLDYITLSKVSPNFIKKVSGVVKKYPKISSYEEYLNYVQAFAGSKDFVKEVKKIAKSGRRPSEQAVQKAKQIASVSTETRKMLLNLLQGITKMERKKYQDSFFKVKMSDLKYAEMQMQKYIDKNDARGQRKYYGNVGVRLLWNAAYKSIYGIGSSKDLLKFEKYPDWEKRVKEYSDSVVDEILTQFIHKNTMKLGNIVNKKNMTESRVVNTKFNGVIMENVLFFAFSDGSKFTVETSTVYSVSKLGKPFLRFPTRFKNVIKGDGSSMSMPSEEKMIKEF